MSADPRPFDLDGPLPRGLFALDASAGTGKTFTLTALATRWLVEGGHDPAALLVVTFTRAAATQLRARIRADLRSAATYLDAVADGRTPPEVHGWIARLADVEPDLRELRRRAAASALVALDQATVTTLHAFCRSALQRLGLLGDIGGRDAARSPRRDRDDVIRDALLRELAPDAHALMDPDDEDSTEPGALERRLLGAVKAVLDDPGAQLLPSPDPSAPVDPSVALRWRGIVDDVARELRRRLDGKDELDFGELIARTDELLADASRGPAAAADLRRQYRLVLVDEMQDTDAAQWRVLRRAFLGDGERYADASDMVIVGDPKQSIYRFRGADVNAYLGACAAADGDASLTVNYRSSPALLSGLDLLLRGATFGAEDIRYVHVSPRPGAEPALSGEDGALEVRWVPRHPKLQGQRRSKDGTVTPKPPTAGALDAHVLGDLAQRAIELLGRARLAGGEDGTERPLRPGDIAVLVASAADAEAVLDALTGAGLPAVRPRSGSVLHSDAVEQWRVLLAALEAPNDRQRVSALLLSWFVAAPLGAIGDAEEVEGLQERCEHWRRELERRGVLPFMLDLSGDERVAGALARVGERGRTDLMHLAELLHAELGARPAPVVSARRALESLVRTTDPGDVDVEDPAVRRLETDGSAIQVMTFHAAKGLEFPVVMLPILTKRTKADRLLPWRYASPSGPVIDVASWSRWRRSSEPSRSGDLPDERAALAAAEDDRDRARVLYVAMTRARERLIVWWSPRPAAEESLLARLLFGRRDEAGALDRTVEPFVAPSDELTEQDLRAWEERSAGAIVVARVPEDLPGARWSAGEGAQDDPLATAMLHREPSEPAVARWSFSALSKVLKGGASAERPVVEPLPLPVPVDGRESDDRPEDRPGRDEDLGGADGGSDADLGAGDGAGAGDGDGDGTSRSGADHGGNGPLAGLAGGTAVGIVLHEILEHVPFEAEDLAAAITTCVEDISPRRLAALGPRIEREELVARVVDGLLRALTTPLDPIHPGLRLRDIAPGDRLAEPEFDLSIADTCSPVVVRDLGAVVAGLLPPGPVRALFERLADTSEDVRIAGWMTGIADLVVRTPDGRYAVLDHKSNLLDGQRYDQTTMEQAACGGLYVLQGLIYLVALHRWLAARLPGYAPADHLGGFALLFLRGMVGADTPVDEHGRREGVWWWEPPVEVVLAADAVLAGHRRSP